MRGRSGTRRREILDWNHRVVNRQRLAGGSDLADERGNLIKRSLKDEQLRAVALTDVTMKVRYNEIFVFMSE